MQAAHAQAAAEHAEADTTELDTVHVTAPRPPDADPFGFRVTPENRFERDWREPVSLERIGMQGGLVMLGLNYALGQAARGMTRLPGWKHQVQGAVARPPPLDEAQARRALEVQAAQDALAQP